MKTSKLTLPVILLAVSASSLLLGTAVVREFAPPRTAVIDIKKVFEEYDRKKSLESTLVVEAQKAEQELADLKGRLKNIEDELKINPEGSAAYDSLILKRTELQLEISKLQREKVKEFQDKHRKAVTGIREEIVREIERYSEAHQLDLVLEYKFSAEGQNAPSLAWPIVHFARPEIDITGEIIKILNERLKTVPR